MKTPDFAILVLKVFDWEVSEDKLLRLQLGDIFSKTDADPVFAVINAACDLQFVPKAIPSTRSPDPARTVYLLPGALRDLKECPKNELTTGLVEINKKWRCIVWDRNKLIAIPHCQVERMLKEKGYDHLIRLRTARALELQQQVFHEASRIGLEVQPPLCEELRIHIFVSKSGQFVSTGNVIESGLVRFHTPKLSVLVIKPSAIDRICEMLLASPDGEGSGNVKALRQAEQRLRAAAALLSKTPLSEPSSDKPSAVKPAKGYTGNEVTGIGIVCSTDLSGSMSWNQNFAAVLGIEEKT